MPGKSSRVLTDTPPYTSLSSIYNTYTCLEKGSRESSLQVPPRQVSGYTRSSLLIFSHITKTLLIYKDYTVLKLYRLKVWSQELSWNDCERDSAAGFACKT
jgi:hypothetical protein